MQFKRPGRHYNETGKISKGEIKEWSFSNLETHAIAATGPEQGPFSIDGSACSQPMRESFAYW